MLILCIFLFNPTLLRRRLKDQIIPHFDLTIDLFYFTEKIIVAVKCFPHIFFCDFKTYVAPRDDVPRCNDISTSMILMFLPFRADTDKDNFYKFKEIIKMAKEMRINTLKSQFVLAIVAVSIVRKTKWGRKVKLYIKWVLSNEEILSAFGKFSYFMIASENKIMAIIEFVVNEMGFRYSKIIKQLVIVSLSLKNMIICRVAVVQYMMSKGMIHKKHPCSLTYLE